MASPGRIYGVFEQSWQEDRLKGDHLIMAQGIFISYRRDTGSTMARMIYDRLRLEKKYECFLDVEKLNAGNFRDNIASEMSKCDIFLLVLSRNALNRCSNPNDNVRQEIESALDMNLAIIPIMAEDFVWPERMPEGLEGIQDYNAIPYVQVYSEEFFERLYSFIGAVRAQEKARENAVRSARAKGAGRASADSVSDYGRYSAKPAETASKKKSPLPIILIGGAAAAAVVILAITLLGKGNQDAAAPAASVAAVSESQEEDHDPEMSSANEEDAVPEAAPAEEDPSAPAAPAEAAVQEETGETAQENIAETAQEAMPVIANGEAVVGGTNQLEAVMIPLDTKIIGTAAEGKTWWYSFQTTDSSDYVISAVDRTHGNSYLGFALCNENGEVLEYSFASRAGEVTSYAKSLEPQKIYYLRIYSNDKDCYEVTVVKP